MPSDVDNAFRRALEPHLAHLFRVACRLCRNAADGEDLLQEVCLRAFERSDAFSRTAEPRAWLLRVQYNLFIDKVRRDGRTRIESIDCAAVGETLHGGTDPADDAAGALLAERISAAWHALTADQQALLAYYAEGHSLKEIGVITELPTSALKARLRRARVRLGNLLRMRDGHERKVAARGETQ